MGEKSRGNWLVGWCGLKEKGCRGRCKKCVRRSESTVVEWGKPEVGRGKGW